MNRFMLNDDNKIFLIKLIFEYVINEKQTVISFVKTNLIVLSDDNECYTVISGLVKANCESKSNQEEADTKVVLHVVQIIQCTPFKVIIRNPPGDTDMVMAPSLTADQDKVYIDSGSGTRKKGIWLKNINLKEAERKELITY